MNLGKQKSLDILGVTVTVAQHNICNITGLNRHWGFQESDAPRFQDSWHMKVVSLSALHTGCLYPPRKYSCYSFLLEAESTPGP